MRHTPAIRISLFLSKITVPQIGEQLLEHKQLMNLLIKFQSNGDKIILWTNRGDNEEYKSLTEAIEWCKEKGLVFDAVNENIPRQKKLSGPSPKIMADFYIDDKALEFKKSSRLRTLYTLALL